MYTNQIKYVTCEIVAYIYLPLPNPLACACTVPDLYVCVYSLNSDLCPKSFLRFKKNISYLEVNSELEKEY
jgi:hypothetical protein